MKTHPTGEVMIVNLPGTDSLLQRTWVIYKSLFPQLIALTALFGLGAFFNVAVQDALTAIVSDGSTLQQTIVKIINTALNVGITGFYFSFIFAAMLFLVDRKEHGKHITIKQACELAREHYMSLFFVGFLLFLMMNGGIVSLVMPFFFSVWFYFALYVVLFGKERGVAALAKSRYLVHGLFFRVLGRYAAMTMIIFVCFSIIWLLLLIPVIGWALFSSAFIALALLIFPFFIVYEYFRYHDLDTVQRNVPFQLFSGEKAGVISWAVFGLLIVVSAWTYDALGTTGQDWLDQHVVLKAAQISLPVTNQWNKNIGQASGILQKLHITTPAVKNNQTY